MDILLDSNGDLDVTNNALSLTDSGGEEVAQSLTIRARTFLGEWDLDTRVGMPYLTDWFVKNPNYGLLGAQFTKMCLETPRVREVVSLEFDLDKNTRTLAVRFTVRIDDDTDLVPVYLELVI